MYSEDDKRDSQAQIPGELPMLLRELRDFDRERKVTCSKDVDDAVVEEPSVEPQLLKQTCEFSSGDSCLEKQIVFAQAVLDIRRDWYLSK